MYLQIAEHIRANITNGKYRQGNVLPPERVFMEEFAVSRVTVRRALKELVSESLIESRQGSGYTVQSQLHQPLNRVTSFSEDCRSRGLIPGSVLISRKSGKSNNEESAHFQVKPATEVLRVRRIRTGNGEPLLVEHVTLLSASAPVWPWPQGSLYRAMANAGQLPVRVRRQYTAVLADVSLSNRLEVPEGSPLMLVVRAGYAENEIPVEYSYCWFRSDRWTFSHEIYR